MFLRNYVDLFPRTSEAADIQHGRIEPCGVRGIDDEKQINKQDGIVNKTFVEMLDKLGYDIQITYVKKEN